MRKRKLLTSALAYAMVITMAGCSSVPNNTGDSNVSSSASVSTDSSDDASSAAVSADADPLSAEIQRINTTYALNLEANTKGDKDIYPYVVHTESLDWYLAAADIEQMGEEAYFNGLADIISLQEADLSDGREALKKYITGEVPVADVYTDFCGVANISEVAGAYYNNASNFIKCFGDWDQTKASLLHEYVHYLTMRCTDVKAKDAFMVEGVAEYVSRIKCHNAMSRSVNQGLPEEAEKTIKSVGAWNYDEGCVDEEKIYFWLAHMYGNGAMVGNQYLTIDSNKTVRTEDIQNSPKSITASYYEACSIFTYLVDVNSEETVMENLGMNMNNFDSVYGKTYSEMYKDWAIWNEEKCRSLGIIFEWDFDELVNGQWRESAKEKAESSSNKKHAVYYDSEDLLNERIVDIFENTDLQSVPEDSDIYKAITVFRQIRDDKWQKEHAKESILEKLDPIENADTSEKLYALFTDEFYSGYNLGAYRVVTYMDGSSVNYIMPKTVNFSGKLSSDQEQGIRDYLVELGYTSKAAKEIVANAKEMDAIIDSFNASVSENITWYYIDQKDLDNSEVTYPLLDNLKEMGSLGAYKEVFTCKEYMDFLKKYYAPGNELKIRDHMLVVATVSLSRFDKSNNGELYNLIFRNLDEADFDITLIKTIQSVTYDVITKEYNSRYVDETSVNEAKEMFEDIKTSMRTIIDDADWLSVHGKEMAKHKILYLNSYFTENGSQCDLSEVELTDDPIGNFMVLSINRNKFWDSQIKVPVDKGELFSGEMLVSNAFYIRERNAMIVCSGLFTDNMYHKDASYEEKLGYLGAMMAHELSHAYDPNGAQYDYKGHYSSWMTEEEYNSYIEKADKIKEFFDGMELADGTKIDGQLVCAETYSDLMAVECCLRILEGMDNPNYDAFFRSYAKSYAACYAEGGLAIAVKDNHLPDKERVNYVLGQFDKFYETYNTDPESKYFVPEEERLKIF